MRPLNEQEKEMIWISLGMRENYIETEDISISAADAQNMGKNAPRKVKIKALSEDQMRLILASKEFVRKVQQGKVFIED